MAILLIILLVTLALAAKAGVGGGLCRPAGSQPIDDVGLIETCTRTLALVLMSLIGLFALGITYGNVLGSGAP